ncbi:nonsense-mediated mRNA decay protein 2-like [Heracleum sosnowskyi]|uniref:Nonsense-mediated mRNA decay protein 2-like n=1 Tax=Heracleum sosnowskyi TaxID=360622 RepID=A0AAD8HLP8_9APIA|nr:nonsense-mediated mRNA decay protein 2-like [Heracleum sosnowskyi]
MAIISDVSYVICEEQDGFVAVDFQFINGHDDEIRDWEIVDDCSSIAEKSDVDVDFHGSVQSDVASECLSDHFSVQDLKSLPEYSPEMFLSYRRSTAADGDVEDDDNLCRNGEDLHELFAGEDMKSRPEYVPEINVGDRELDTAESMEEMLARFRQIDHELLSYRSFRDYDYDYSYDRQEEEEDDYDLDDELVPYSAKVKLGRERMRKLGKRSCSKLVKSKRLTYNYNKAGCLRGKHGLGLKHSLI